MWIKSSETDYTNLDNCVNIELSHADGNGGVLPGRWIVGCSLDAVDPIHGTLMPAVIGEYLTKTDAEAVLAEIEQGLKEHLPFIELKEKAFTY